MHLAGFKAFDQQPEPFRGIYELSDADLSPQSFESFSNIDAAFAMFIDLTPPRSWLTGEAREESIRTHKIDISQWPEGK